MAQRGWQFDVFSGGHLSQYHKCDIMIDGIKYTSSMQYMVHQKAGEFMLDTETRFIHL
jgi:predicted NAD-dependent protein-ADP-ribosyltransferase YbiA (DUF1768 family)